MSICQTVVLINCQLIVYWTKFQIQFTSGRIQQDSSRVKSDCLGDWITHGNVGLCERKRGKKNPQAEQIKEESRLRLGYRGFPPTGQSFTGRGVGTRRRAFTAAAGDGTVVNKRNVSNTAIRLDKRGGGFHRAKNRTADMITKLMSNEHMKRMLSASEH